MKDKVRKENGAFVSPFTLRPSYFILFFIPPIVGVVFAILASAHSPALPIDDAYILRRYAVNFASGLGWSFNPNETSFGSTSFLFPAICALPMMISDSLKFESIAYILGLLSFIPLIIIIEWWIWSETRNIALALIGGTLLAITPMGYMNAVSGMESMTFGFAVIGILALHKKIRLKYPFLLGILSGLCFLTRPEGLYLAIAIPGAEFLAGLRAGEKPKLVDFTKYFAGFALLALPYVAIVRALTPGFLPTTYAGKIITTDPKMHISIAWDVLKGFDHVYKGHWRCMADYGFSGIVFWWLMAGSAAFIISALLSGKAIGASRTVMAAWGVLLVAPTAIAFFAVEQSIYLLAFSMLLLTGLWAVLLIILTRSPGHASIPHPANIALLGLLLVPFAYGALFRAGPIFGGYYQRYITPVLPAMIIIAMLGAHMLLGQTPIKHRKIVLIWLFLLCGYSLYLNVRRLPEHRENYMREARLNSVVRMGAAKWINENTPKDARVLVGYTGLGVVGGFSERYVLDMGALINPDIFDYYKDVPAIGEKRWERTKKYIADRGVDYFVTVPGLSIMGREDRSSNPGGEPGFELAATIKDPEVVGNFSTITIWKIDRSKIGFRL